MEWITLPWAPNHAFILPLFSEIQKVTVWIPNGHAKIEKILANRLIIERKGALHFANSFWIFWWGRK